MIGTRHEQSHCHERSTKNLTSTAQTNKTIEQHFKAQKASLLRRQKLAAPTRATAGNAQIGAHAHNAFEATTGCGF